MKRRRNSSKGFASFMCIKNVRRNSFLNNIIGRGFGSLFSVRCVTHLYVPLINQLLTSVIFKIFR